VEPRAKTDQPPQPKGPKVYLDGFEDSKAIYPKEIQRIFLECVLKLDPCVLLGLMEL
jgi:hypothetical protein